MPEHASVKAALERAQEGIDKLRHELQKNFPGRDDIIIGVNGSYARGEVTSGSDVDIFVLGLDSTKNYNADKDHVIEVIRSLSLKPPSPGGVFERPLYLTDLLKNIGGMGDTNESITRRMLFLLEGEWILNQPEFDKARRNMVHVYVKDDIAADKVCRYLLSDIIRYWRTMCVDYEHKHASGKPPGLRRIKLRFSRCLMYFAGVLAVAETVGHDPAAKRAYLEGSFQTRAIERIQKILGSQSSRLLELYDDFLADIHQESLRNRLESVGYEESYEYQKLRERARQFRDELVAQLRNRYPPYHDVMYALLI
jgi:predicted nucleotidyltransferase